MTRKRSITWAGLAVALATAAAMLIAGSDPALTLGVVLLWGGSLWLQAPEPEPAPRRFDAREVSQDAARETIEALGQPVLLLEGSRIAMANDAARTVLGGHIGGQDARIALRHPEALRLLEMDDGAWVEVAGLTGARTLWRLTRRGIGGERWLIELSDRTAEADVSRAHTDFVANASHELRTPLASIIGYAETLEDAGTKTDAATSRRFIGIIHREAQRMLALVGDLMTLSHVEAEKHERPTEPVDLSKLAAQIVAEVSSLDGKERVELAGAGTGQVVAGDAQQLEQVLRNLIDNALKYGAQDKPVSVSVRSLPGKARIEITDQGPGIAPEHLPHLTRRFYRTDPGRSRALGGTGLGLAIVKHIVERHGGELQIDSTLGEGTTVCATFPLVQGQSL